MIVVGIVAGWLGFNVLVLAGAVVLAWHRRNEPVHPDVHELLDRRRL